MYGKKIVNGILYDIYKADLLVSISDGQQRIYRGQNGRCFLLHDDEIYPLTDSEAIEWLEENGLTEIAIKEFELEEA